ncbi:hypothetical protein QBC33DRAFT_573343 [Phialemonium atrogriseum]|uniref:Uncharacterized protein n=1 Tax=Phialemonium atrogriseum TaxID=1093897 RepID=A0AAJ0FCB9_9PEZI|nr:uncharacterized protein QBC33DRAFT_573343 [Phialemonium atrogriseum]KAK1763436.1 hypothetical protein QBC33DRAFT_573343 [Phialemonium atrogriseum]
MQTEAPKSNHQTMPIPPTQSPETASPATSLVVQATPAHHHALSNDGGDRHHQHHRRDYQEPRPGPGATAWAGVGVGATGLVIILGLAAWAWRRSRWEVREEPVGDAEMGERGGGK